MAETLFTFPDPEMPIIIPDFGIKRPKIYSEMNYLEKKHINKAIRQKMRNKDVYKSDMQKIYNIIVDQMNEQLQEKAASCTAIQAFKTD